MTHPYHVARSCTREALGFADLDAATSAFMHQLERCGWRIVPADPTRAMTVASMAALTSLSGLYPDRPRPGWIDSTYDKHRCRLIAAIQAAPNWRAALKQARD